MKVNTAASMQTAREMFAIKLPTILRACDFRARKYRLRPDEAEEVQQEASLALWRVCLALEKRGASDVQISTGMMAASGFIQWRRRFRPVRAKPFSDFWAEDDLIDPLQVQAPPEGIRCGMGRYLMADARIDNPAIYGLFETGVTNKTVRERLGLTRQRVHQLADKLGGTQMPNGEWLFPADAGLKAVAV